MSGVSLAVFVPASYDTSAWAVEPAAVFSVNVRVDVSIGALKVAVTVEIRATPVALDAGVVPVTVGGVVLAAAVSTIGSTQ